MTKKLYRLVDKYEGEHELIYSSNSLQEVINYASYYCEEVVDGECYLCFYRLNAKGTYSEIKVEW